MTDDVLGLAGEAIGKPHHRRNPTRARALIPTRPPVARDRGIARLPERPEIFLQHVHREEGVIGPQQFVEPHMLRHRAEMAAIAEQQPADAFAGEVLPRRSRNARLSCRAGRTMRLASSKRTRSSTCAV